MGSTTLDHITTTALANLLSAVASGKIDNVAVVLTDLGGAAYTEGSQHINDAIQDLEAETDRTVQKIDPVKLNSDELYHILRTRLFEQTASLEDVAEVADAYMKVVDDARKTDQTNASPETIRAQILESYPFHPAIRDLYARFRENPSFQQTRALIRLMRGIVAGLYTGGGARQKHLVGVHDLDLHHGDVLNEVRQINRRFDNAIAHDIASEGQTAVAEVIDRGSASSDAADAAKLIFMSSLSQAVNPTLGLDRGSLVAYLAAPGRDLNGLRAALDDLQAQAWYIHAAPSGQLLFRDVQNLNAMLETFAQGIQPPQRDQELRDRLKEMFDPKTKAVYQETAFLPALDQVEPREDRVTLVVFRPGSGAREEIERFWEHQPLKNRLLFLTGSEAGYARVLQRASYLWAVRKILEKLKREGMAEADPTYQEARELESREEAAFYLACRETFQTLLYPHRSLTEKELDPRYVANNYEGETQINEALAEVHKYRPDAAVQLDQMRDSIERKLWPAEAKVASWSEIRKRAASDPTWFFTHPRALDDIRDGLVKQDRWRDRGDGFIEHGPFPKEPARVQIQVLSRDPDTGRVKLRIKPLHGDRVLRETQGAATLSSAQLDSYDVETDDLTLSFLAVDTTGEHLSADPYLWQNEITLKHRFYQDNDKLMCELRAIPCGEIRYTTDGSSPLTSGKLYTAPFAAPENSKAVIAVAEAEGIQSERMVFDVPEKGEGFTLDPQKPAVWRRRFNRDSTGDVYDLLEVLERHRAWPGGMALVTQRDQRWVDLRTDDRTFQEPGAIRNQATLLGEVIRGGNTTIDVETLQFSRGQDLLDLVAELKTSLQPDEIEQQA